MESADKPIATSPASSEWLPLNAAFAPAEIARLFEADSPLLRVNPYALCAPPNTQRARRSDWKVFTRFCAERQYLALPASPAVVATFIEAMSPQRLRAPPGRSQHSSGMSRRSRTPTRSPNCRIRPGPPT